MKLLNRKTTSQTSNSKDPLTIAAVCEICGPSSSVLTLAVARSTASRTLPAHLCQLKRPFHLAIVLLPELNDLLCRSSDPIPPSKILADHKSPSTASKPLTHVFPQDRQAQDRRTPRVLSIERILQSERSSVPSRSVCCASCRPSVRRSLERLAARVPPSEGCRLATLSGSRR